MPSEGNHVLNVSAIGPSTTKADYSNYGLEHDLGRRTRWLLP